MTLFLSFSFGGKTVVLMDATLSTALGLKAWRYFPCTSGRVVHLDCEQGANETIDRYQRLAHGRGVPVEYRAMLPSTSRSIQPRTSGAWARRRPSSARSMERTSR